LSRVLGRGVVMANEMAEVFVTHTFVVTAKNGLHIRPAEQLARLANQFASQIGLIYESQRVDAKSIMEMLTLGASEGASVVIEARGEDAQQAVDAIMSLVQSEFATTPKSETATNESS
jgi:phosphocarrier protein HPr